MRLASVGGLHLRHAAESSTVFNGSLRSLRIALCLIARSTRCDVRRVPPSSSDLAERKASSRHLLLQIAGANIAKPPTSSSLADEMRVRSLLLSSAARDPVFNGSLSAC
jgi:hypothetical protein